MTPHGTRIPWLTRQDQETEAIACVKVASEEGIMEHQPGTEEAQSYGGQLRERREDIGISQIELATIAGVSRGTIRNAEGDMGLHARTLANVLRALSCVPSAAQENAIVPLLTAGTMRIIAKVLLNSYGIRNSIAYDRRPYELEEWHEELTDRFFKLLDAAAEAGRQSPPSGDGFGGIGVNVPASFHEFRKRLNDFRTLLEHVLDADHLRAFDQEMLRWFGNGYPYPPPEQAFTPVQAQVRVTTRTSMAASSATVGSSRPEIRAILASGLPEVMKASLIEYANGRQHQLSMQLNDEVLQMIGTLQAAREEAERDGDG